MKKKLLCMLLAVFMAAVLLPVTVMAQSETATGSDWYKLDKAMRGEAQATVENVFEVDDSEPGVRTIKLLKHIVALDAGNSDLKVLGGGGKTIILDLNGYDIVSNVSARVITVESKGVFILNDSSVEKKGKIIRGRIQDYQDGGGVYVNGGKFTMNGGTISGNTAEGNGGGVAVRGGSFTMTGGTISGNSTESDGGGVYVKRGSFTMTGGRISSNTAGSDGGGVYIFDGSFTMTGGEITGNTAVFGGGVWFPQSTVILGGTAKIKDNMRKNYKNPSQNLFVGYDGKITIGSGDNGVDAPAEGMDIGVTMASGKGRFTTNGTADNAKYFSADNNACTVKYNEGGYLELVEKVQEEVDPEKDDPTQPEESKKSPPTGITENNMTTPFMIGMIVLAVAGLCIVMSKRNMD